MKKIQALLFPIFLLPLVAICQESLKLHAHNDYLQEVPFWTAFAAEAQSIEVDLVLKDATLFVAHEPESILPGRTLTTLYLEPIRQAKALALKPDTAFDLLIDLKSDAKKSLDLLLREVMPYEQLLYSDSNPTGLRLIISGNRPPVSEYATYPDFIHFDYQSLNWEADLPWEKIGMVSFSFRNFSDWNGKGGLPLEDQKKLQNIRDRVHAQDKPIRFWATPDTKTAWKFFHDLEVNYLNTDHPLEARSYLKTLNQNTLPIQSHHIPVTPSYRTDGSRIPLKKIILMIGDGTGLAQISLGMLSNQGELNLSQLKHLGLLKTQASDDFTTDSAAGATALATGQKTNNRMIAMSPKGDAMRTLPELVAAQGFRSGIVTTDAITGATPASFYAHHPERGDALAIANWLPNSPLSLLAGGGKGLVEFTPSIREEMKAQGFTFFQNMKELKNTSAERVALLRTDTPSIKAGRGDWFPQMAQAAAQFLNEADSPFFLLLEGAQIDWGGHAQDGQMTLEELLDFDRVVGDMIQFVDQNPGTLLLVTADHETGGLTIPRGDLTQKTLEVSFYSEDHTAIPVPLFAYGTHADAFLGIYENTDVFHRILDILQLNSDESGTR